MFQAGPPALAAFATVARWEPSTLLSLPTAAIICSLTYGPSSAVDITVLAAAGWAGTSASFFHPASNQGAARFRHPYGTARLSSHRFESQWLDSHRFDSHRFDSHEKKKCKKQNTP